MTTLQRRAFVAQAAKRRTRAALVRAGERAHVRQRPEGLALDYSRALRRFCKSFFADVRAEFGVREDADEGKGPALPAATVLAKIEKLKAKAQAKAQAAAAQLAAASAKGVAKKAAKVGAEVMGVAMPTAATSPKIANALAEYQARNVALIESIPRQMLGDVQRVLTEGSGWGVEMLGGILAERFGVAQSRAEFIALDQTLKLNGQLMRLQSEEVGATEYIWVSSRDERVRDTHAALNGERFSFADPPDVGDGRRCNPGEDFRCRCTAYPVLDEERAAAWQEKLKGGTGAAQAPVVPVAQPAPATFAQPVAAPTFTQPRPVFSSFAPLAQPPSTVVEAERIAAEREAQRAAEALRLTQVRAAESELAAARAAQAERLAKLEAERLAKLEAERLAKLEAERLAKLEAERLAKLEEERLAKLEAERLAKLEAEKAKAKLEAEKLAAKKVKPKYAPLEFTPEQQAAKKKAAEEIARAAQAEQQADRANAYVRKAYEATKETPPDFAKYDPQKFAHIAEQSKDLASRVTAAQRDAMLKFSVNHYTGIRAAQQGKSFDEVRRAVVEKWGMVFEGEALDQHVRECIEAARALADADRDLATFSKIPVYRGLALSDTELASMLEAGEFSNGAVSSASAMPHQAIQFAESTLNKSADANGLRRSNAVILEIKGARGLALAHEDLSEIVSEGEFLLSKKGKYRITGVSRLSADRALTPTFVIHAEEHAR